MKLLATLLAAYTIAGSLDAHAATLESYNQQQAAQDYKVCLHTGKLHGVAMEEQECWENTFGALSSEEEEAEEEDYSDSGVGCVDDCLDSQQEIYQQ